MKMVSEKKSKIIIIIIKSLFKYHCNESRETFNSPKICLDLKTDNLFYC